MTIGATLVDGGARFRVWAPRPRTLELEIDGRRIPVPRDAAGFGDLVVPGVGPGARYSYVLDGDRRRPDPASRAQPDGVHGPSQLVDPRAHRWRDVGYSAPPLDAIYELHVGTFSGRNSDFGTFDGVAENLERPLAAGFRVIELLPVGAWPGARGWGYDGVHWLAPHAAYGGPERLRALVDRCHEKGVAVVLDVVFNHLGPEGNYLGEFAPYFDETKHTPWGAALDLDGPHARPVRDHIIGVCRALVDEFHLDGVRLDAVHAFVDDSPVHLVAELTAALHADGARRGRPVWVIAESDLGRARVVEPADEGGWGCDAMWHDDFHHALHSVVTGERHTYYADYGSSLQLARALERGFAHTGRKTRFRKATWGEPYAHLDGARIVACAQNHDQIGNRARGDRMAALRPGCEHAVAVALLTAPFLPMIFMGEEHGETAPFPYFTSFADENLARAVREGRRREYGEGAPDPQAEETFRSARMGTVVAGTRAAGLVALHRRLLELKRTRPSLASTRLALTEAIAEGRTIVVRRLAERADAGETLVVYHLDGRTDGPAVSVELPAPRHGAWRTLVDVGQFGGPKGARLDGLTATLPPWGALVLGAP